MSENLRQSLSALMDNEADELEMRRTLQQLDDQGADAWRRYHLIGAVIKGERPGAGLDVSAGVMAELDDEPVYHLKPEKAGLFWKPLASVAVAASVTAMVIFGAQSLQTGTGVSATETLASNQGAIRKGVANQDLVLPGPSPIARGLLPAQYGSGGQLSVSTGGAEPDVIRFSYGMEHYINQHNALLRSKQKSWSAGWLPKGFAPVRHEVMPDSEVMIYSDGRADISVCVEPYGSHKSAPGAAQFGDTVALGKRVGGQFVTVVGDVPLMIADRIADSVNPARQ